MACCLSPSCCPGRNARRPATKSAGRASTAVVRPSKKTATPSTAAEPPTPATSTVLPDMVDRLRRRLCQDDTDSDDVTQRRSPCRCCRRCLGDDEGPQATGSEPRPSPVRPDPTTASPTPDEIPGTTENADFMTLFFRNCEKIVFDNAAAIHEMLTGPANVEEEQRDSADWTSNRTEPSSSANTVEQRRHLSDVDDNVAYISRSDVTEEAETSASCGRTEGSVERLIAPANSPVSAGSLLTSSLSDDALLTTCVCSPSMRAAYDDDGPFVRRRPSVSGQSPAAVNAVTSITDRYKNTWRRRRRRVIVRTSTDDNDNGYLEVVVNRKSAGISPFPVGLGSRPPCLGQECSPIRSTPCGAGLETGSSAATAGTTSGGPTRRVLPTGRVDQGRVVAFCRRKRRESGPPTRRSVPLTDAPSPAVVQQSYRKVNTWLRHHAAPEAKTDVISPACGHQSTPEYQLKRKLIRGEADSSAKRRVTDSDSCSLPSGTFTSDDEEDEIDDNDENHADGTTNREQISGFPASPLSRARPRLPMTSPRRKMRSPLADVVCSRRRKSNTENVSRRCEWEDVSSGALGDRSSSLATSGDLAPCHRHQSSPIAAKTRAASRKNAIERRREVVRRVTRMARRLHRVAAADVVSNIHVQTLAVL